PRARGAVSWGKEVGRTHYRCKRSACGKRIMRDRNRREARESQPHDLHGLHFETSFRRAIGDLLTSTRSAPMITRRHAVKNIALTSGALALSANGLLAQAPAAPASEAEGGFKLPPLGYDYDALEPFIDAETMRIHHDKHHA